MQSTRRGGGRGGGRAAKPKKHEEGTSKNKRKQVEAMDSTLSGSHTSFNNHSDSWECPPSYMKSSIPDSKMVSSRRASLRSAKRLTEIERPSVSRCSHPHQSTEHPSTTAVFQQLDDPVDTNLISAYQAPAGSIESPSRYLSPLANHSTFSQEMRHEMTEKVGNSVPPERFTVDIPVVEEVHVAVISMPNNQMEGLNTFQTECIPLEQQPLAEDIQASNNFGERANRNRSNPISVVGRLSASSSLNLTEVINLMKEDEEDEVNSVGQSLPMDDTADKYQVKPESLPILRKILSNHGDIVKNCSVVTMKCRSMLLEMICDIITELQNTDFCKIKEDDGLHDMIALVNEIKSMNVDIEWLHQRLLEITEARQILKQSGMLKKRKEHNRKAIENVERELREYEEEKKAIAAKLQSIYDRETVCKETLARERDESTRITATIGDAKSKVKHFLNCSLADGLL